MHNKDKNLIYILIKSTICQMMMNNVTMWNVKIVVRICIFLLNQDSQSETDHPSNQYLYPRKEKEPVKTVDIYHV